MQPNQPTDNRTLSVPQRSGSTPPDREAAARLMREQIDRIYEQPVTAATPANQPPAATTVPESYERTHDDATAYHATDPRALQRYHSAWQQYYQQYYERYYLQQLHRHRTRTTPQQSVPPSDDLPLEDSTPEIGAAEDSIVKDKAVRDIKTEVLDKVRLQTRKVRSSRHFVPILAAIIVMVAFVGLQYNRVFVAQVKAYVSPGAISPQNIILDPTASVAVGPEPKLIIPKINVEAPVVYGINSLAEATVQNALKDGVVHYPVPGASSLPGEKGNNVIIGHSSNDVFDDGKYKFVFVQLDKLEPGDTFYLHYGGLRYTYSVTKKEVILPTEINKLILPADRPVATLITCTPIGTAEKRLVVYADQISPDPDTAAASTQTAAGDEESALPGYSPTFLDRLFGR